MEITVKEAFDKKLCRTSGVYLTHKGKYVSFLMSHHGGESYSVWYSMTYYPGSTQSVKSTDKLWVEMR